MQTRFDRRGVVAILAAFVGACSSGSGGDGASDFDVLVTPDVRAIAAGSYSTLLITADEIGSFGAGITLTVAPDINGVTYSYPGVAPGDDPVVGAGDSILLFIDAAALATQGAQTLTITGTSGSKVRSFDVSLTIDPPALPGAELSGEIQFVPESAPLTLLEKAPTFDGDLARTHVAAGRGARLRGELGAGRQALRLFADEPVLVSAHLVGATSARLAHVDPVSLDVGPAGRASSFVARGPFDLIVRGADGPFEVQVSARALGAHVALAGHLGAFAVGDELALRAEPLTQARLSCAESLDLAVASTGALDVLDLHGVVVASLGELGGELSIAAAPLASYTLRSIATVRSDVLLRALAASAPRPVAAVHPLDLERQRFAVLGATSLATQIEHEFVAGELLVRGRGGVELATEIAARSGRISQRIPETSDLVEFELPAGLDELERARTTLALIASFETSARVEFAEPNRIRRAFGAAGGTLEPNDTHYPKQKWHYDLINMPAAWTLTQGDPGVIVAVIDTGLRQHTDLNSNQLTTGFDFISSAANAGDGNGIDSDETDIGDGNGLSPSSFHGTHVAGTIGAVGNNNSGVTGVNWDVSIMHLRVLGKQGGTDADIAQAVRYAARLSNNSGTLPPTRADIINMSLGGPGSTSTMQNAITAARGAGVVIFAAAGNENSSTPSFPAAYTGVTSVSAVDRNANKAPYSNFHPTVDIAAPGGDTSVDLDGDGFVDGVLSTLVDEPAHNPIFVFYQGTSMACPHVAGVAALMLAVEPTLTPDEIEQFLEDTALDLGSAGHDNIFGHGLVQADAAVIAALGSTSTTPVLVTSPSTLNFGDSATFLVIGVTNAGGGALDVTGATFAFVSGPQAFAPTAIDLIAGGTGTNVSSIEVTVDRTGLAIGDYAGTITVASSNGGSRDVAVQMQVEVPPNPLDVDLFVVLVDPETLDVVRAVQVNPTVALDFDIDFAVTLDGTPVPINPGSYLLLCGSDDNNNNFIFDSGDIYTGGWPTLNDVQLITVDGDDVLTGLDFVVAPEQSTFAPAARFPSGLSLGRALRQDD